MGIKNPGVPIVDDDETAEQASSANEPSLAMDAIAIGVEAKLDPFSAYSKIVTQRTIQIAQWLGIAKEEIQQWARARAKLDSQRNKVINTVYPELSLEERIWEPEGTETKGLYEL